MSLRIRGSLVAKGYDSANLYVDPPELAGAVGQKLIINSVGFSLYEEDILVLVGTDDEEYFRIFGGARTTGSMAFEPHPIKLPENVGLRIRKTSSATNSVSYIIDYRIQQI